MNTEEKIINIIKQNGKTKASYISDELNISRQMTHRHLKKLQEKNIIIKFGSAPYTYYEINKKNTQTSKQDTKIPAEIKKIIEQNFLHIDTFGNRIDGIKGFTEWCNNRNYQVKEYAKKYIETLNQYKNLENSSGILSGQQKFQETFPKTHTKDVFYLDFYSIPTFGKTKLGKLLLYGKQSQNKQLIYEVADLCREPLKKIIKTKKIDAVAFVPPTVKRENQFMKLFAKRLALPIPQISIKKVSQAIPIPQKTLSKLKDRIINAQTTFSIDDQRQFKNILLIDDAIGSGATINELALQLKEKQTAQNVYGLAITGSAKGFDVISEV